MVENRRNRDRHKVGNDTCFNKGVWRICKRMRADMHKGEEKMYACCIHFLFITCIHCCAACIHAVPLHSTVTCCYRCCYVLGIFESQFHRKDSVTLQIFFYNVAFSFLWWFEIELIRIIFIYRSAFPFFHEYTFSTPFVFDFQKCKYFSRTLIFKVDTWKMGKSHSKQWYVL